MSKEKYFSLEFAESLQEDIDKGMARIPSKIMDSFRLVSGNIVEIKAKTSTAVKVMRVINDDENYKTIRLDGTIRSNIGASIGDEVKITPIKITEAKLIKLSPLQEVKFSNDPTEYFHSKLLHKPLSTGQKTVIDVFGNRLEYVILKSNPKGHVIVTSSTKIVVSDEPYSGDLKSTGITYEDVGGLKNEVELIREMVELPMNHPEIFQKLGVGAP